MSLRRRLSAGLGAVVMASGIAVAVTPTPALAHGATTNPASRTFACFSDGTGGTYGGQIIPRNAACASAVAAGGTQPLYDWYGVLRSDGGGRTSGYIPDGQLCSGGFAKFDAYNEPRADWPSTSVTSGQNLTVKYGGWVPHPGAFKFYVSRQGYDVTQPLTWADLGDPIATFNPQPTITPASGSDLWPSYVMNVTLPARTGKQIFYAVWWRSDSQETFYSCSDINYGGGSVPSSAAPTSRAPITSAAPTSRAPITSAAPTSRAPLTSRPPVCGQFSTCPPTTSRPPIVTSAVPTTGGGSTGPCTATYTVTGSWNTGFQGDVTIKNNTSSPLNGWTVTLTFANGQTVSQIWSATATNSGSTYTIKPVGYNTVIPANGTVNFGFLGSWSGTNPLPVVTCTSP